MQYLIIRFVCATLALQAFWSTNCSGQNQSDSAIADEWQTSKQAFLYDINRSLNLILQQLDTLESKLRNEGSFDKVKALTEIRALFVEKGEIHRSIDRAEYDRVREQAVQSFASRKKELLTKALQARNDSIAEIIKLEHDELSNPLVADINARWASAIANYHTERDEAKALIVSQLEKIESKARTDADPAAVATAKKAKADFLENVALPTGVAKGPYEARINKAKDRLQQINKSLVRTLLLNNQDDMASSMASSLGTAVVSPKFGKSLQTRHVDDSRKAWRNISYNTTFFHREGDAWEEVNLSGKLEKKVRELSRNNDYVEVMLIERQHLLRLFKDHAEMLKDGRWQWVANGEWILE